MTRKQNTIMHISFILIFFFFVYQIMMSKYKLYLSAHMLCVLSAYLPIIYNNKVKKNDQI